MPRLVMKDYYLVLGVPHQATADQIKAAYRARVREVHPDLLGPDASDDDRQEAKALTQEVNEAWGCLSVPDLKAEVDNWLGVNTAAEPRDFGYGPGWNIKSQKKTPPRPKRQPITVPQPEAFQVDGIWCWIEYSASIWSDQLRATVRVPLDDLFKISELNDLPHGSFLSEILAVDAKGDIVGSGYSLMFLRNDVRKLQAEARRNEHRRVWRQQLEVLQQEYDQLERQNMPVGRLRSLITKAQNDVESGRDRWWQAQQYSTVVKSIREAQKEAERVKTTPPEELLQEDLLAGKIPHPDLGYNQKLLEKLAVYEFRSGGQVMAPTPEEVREHYRRRLEGLTTQQQVQRTDLKLPDDEPAILELTAEGAIELAPETIQVQNGHKTHTYPVTYARAKVDGALLPTGLITVPEAVYEKVGARHGRASQFPALPYGITLLVRVCVKVQDHSMLTDPHPDGKSLQNEVRRCQARLRNPRIQDSSPMTTSLDLWPY
jgi:hypothetical protein